MESFDAGPTVLDLGRFHDARAAFVADVRWVREALLFGAGPAEVVAMLVYLLARQHLLALDFHYWFWPAGHRVLAGQSPYALPYPRGLSYPALTALGLAPWALLPPAVADFVITAVALLSVTAILWLLQVRDWRVYGLAFLWPALAYGWQTANLSLLLLTGIAAAWRWRDRPIVAGGLIAAVVAMKPVFLPIVLWLLATRRYRATVYAVAAAALLTVGSFAVLGFDQLPAYMTQTHLALADLERHGYSLFTLVLKLSGSHFAGYGIIVTLAFVTAVACVRSGRAGRDPESISLAIATMLLVSPTVESHYLAVLVIPLALARPRLSILWLLPLSLWITPEDWPSVWQQVLVIVAYAFLLSASIHALRAPTRRWVFAVRPLRAALRRSHADG